MTSQSPGARGDRMLRAVSSDGSLSVRALEATALVGEAAARHATTPVATAALGRALMGAVLLGAMGKGEETVQLRFRGDGPLRSIVAMADAAGRVRGFVGDASASVPAREGRLDVGGAVGAGQLSVVRWAPGWREPYTGIVPLVSGEIARDLAHYLLESEQKPSAVALGVYLESDGAVGAAGGFLAQAFPGATEEALERLEANVRTLPPPSEMVRSAGGPEGMAAGLLAGLGGRVLERTQPVFHCGCNEERVLRAVTLLGGDELREMEGRGEAVEVRCEFCGEEYRVAPERARALLAGA